MPRCRPSYPCRRGLWTFRRGPCRPPAPPHLLLLFRLPLSRSLALLLSPPLASAHRSRTARIGADSELRHILLVPQAQGIGPGEPEPTQSSSTPPASAALRRASLAAVLPSPVTPTEPLAQGEFPSRVRAPPFPPLPLARRRLAGGHRRPPWPCVGRAPAWAGQKAGGLWHCPGLAPSLGRHRGRTPRATPRPRARSGPASGPIASATAPACAPAWADLKAGLHSKNRFLV